MIKTLKLKKRINKILKPVVFASAGLAIMFGSGIGCKTADINPDTAPYATIQLKDVFTNAGLGGRVVVNGTDGQGGDTYRIDSGTITSIEVEVDGYKSTYVLGIVGDKIEFARDKNGTFKKYYMKSDKTIQVMLVPNDFDTETLAKSIGNQVGNGDTLGDGTVIRYDKRSIDVALWELEVAAGDAEKNLKDAIDMININNKIIKLNYKGKVNTYITNGVTHIIKENHNPVHDEEFDKNTNIISRSDIKTMPTASFSAILEELTQASTGLRADGGSDKFPYESQGQLINDASRAICLVNFSPTGFQYDPNNPDPASSQTIKVCTTVADQNVEDAMKRGNSYVKPLGVDRMPMDYNEPGRIPNKHIDKRHKR